MDSLKEMITEHKRLVKVLKNPTKQNLKSELATQGKELKEYAMKFTKSYLKKESKEPPIKKMTKQEKVHETKEPKKHETVEHKGKVLAKQIYSKLKYSK